jgi:hypothetical protein
MEQVYTLPSGKELTVVKNGTGLFKLQFTSGGELPKELAGLFTSPSEADKTMRMYVARKEAEAAKKPAKAEKKTDKTEEK